MNVGRTLCADPPAGLDTQDQAELVLAVIDKLQLGRVYVLGTSQGGFIAARMALLAPDKVRAAPQTAKEKRHKR